jgi:hypothetical protein
MRKKKNNGKIKLILSGVLLTFIVIVYILLANKDKLADILPTAESTAEENMPDSVISSLDDMVDGQFYVESKNSSGKTIYTAVQYGNANWTKKYDATNTANSMWFNAGEDESIPTVKSDTKLLFHSTSMVPTEIIWERYADYGYSIGISNLYYDTSGHYYLESDDKKGFQGFINPDSSATVLNDYKDYDRLFLDKVGNTKIDSESMSPSGSVLGLNKNKDYICSFYTGTYYQDFRLKADTRVFSHLENYTTYGYSFLHSNCIEITIPRWLKSGYYLINNYGLIRYVSKDDEASYNGETYNESIDWNDTLIKYDEKGRVTYDPTGDNGAVNNSMTTNGNSSSETQSSTESQGNSAYSYDPYASVKSPEETSTTDADDGDEGIDDSEYDDQDIPDDGTSDDIE